MKLIIFIFILFLLCCKANAQIEDLEHASIFNKCEITYNDNKVVDGYIAFFLENLNNDQEDILSSSIERMFNLDDNNWEFKTSVSDTPKNMSQKNIKLIKVYYSLDVIKTYKLMDIKKINKDGTIINTSKKAWLPVIKDDVISLYQMNIYTNIQKYSRKEKDYVTKKTKKFFTLTYLSNQKQNIAFEVYDLLKPRMSKPNLGDAYLGKVLEYIFQECPSFLDKIMKNKKWNYKSFVDDTTNYDTQIKEIKESNLNDFEKHRKIDDLDIKKESQPFIKLIEEFKLNCN